MPASPSDISNQNKALFLRFFDAVNSWDFDALRELIHPDVVFEMPYMADPQPKRIDGLTNLMVYLENVANFFLEENLHNIVMNTFSEDPNELVAEFVSDMKLKSGKKYTNIYIMRATVRDRKFVRICEYFDPIKGIQAMGGSVIMPDVAVT